MVGGGLRIGNQDRGQAIGGDLEHRATRARDHEVGRGQRSGEFLQIQILAQVIPVGQSAGGQLGMVAAPGDVQHVHGSTTVAAPHAQKTSPSCLARVLAGRVASIGGLLRAARECLDGGEVDRARAERTPEHEHARLVARRSRNSARASSRPASGTGIGRPVTR